MSTGISLVRQAHYLSTIKAIVTSPCVKRFVVGYTSKGAWKRLGGYRKEGCDHLVVLADALTFFQADHLERTLQDRIWSDGRSILFKKYDPARRDKKGFYGAPIPKADNKSHAVYLAWWE
jgi:hypothetical protein